MAPRLQVVSMATRHQCLSRQPCQSICRRQLKCQASLLSTLVIRTMRSHCQLPGQPGLLGSMSPTSCTQTQPPRHIPRFICRSDAALIYKLCREEALEPFTFCMSTISLFRITATPCAEVALGDSDVHILIRLPYNWCIVFRSSCVRCVSCRHSIPSLSSLRSWFTQFHLLFTLPVRLPFPDMFRVPIARAAFVRLPDLWPAVGCVF